MQANMQNNAKQGKKKQPMAALNTDYFWRLDKKA